jgi:hypothetical protein
MTVVRRRRTKVETPPPGPPPAASADSGPELYVRWRNDTGRAVTGVVCKGKEVEGWIPTRTFSLPESCTKQCEDAGLTRVGFARGQ